MHDAEIDMPSCKRDDSPFTLRHPEDVSSHFRSRKDRADVMVSASIY